ncbi:hypothetical protein VTJ04DRAFT_6616 [Mycothermus thermophilus]|uniref:uncharacterized protein n=1 Tax=Humicola insolens TaxID=85995 RepID=UPI003743C1A9
MLRYLYPCRTRRFHVPGKLRARLVSAPSVRCTSRSWTQKLGICGGSTEAPAPHLQHGPHNPQQQATTELSNGVSARVLTTVPNWEATVELTLGCYHTSNFQLLQVHQSLHLTTRRQKTPNTYREPHSCKIGPLSGVPECFRIKDFQESNLVVVDAQWKLRHRNSPST